MKPYLLITLLTLLIFPGCNNDDKTTATVNPDGTLSEMPLPKGRLVISDELLATDKTDAGTFNGVDNKNNPVTDPVTATQKRGEGLRRRYKNLLIFHAEDTMKIKRSYIATLILGKDQLLEEMKSEALGNAVENNNNLHVDSTLDFGNKMKAKLVDLGGATDKGFEIEMMADPDAATQSITDKRKEVRWAWKLTPLTPGEQHLSLQISILEKDGESVTLPTTTIPVVIYAENDVLSKVGSFFNDTNTKWLITAILIPVIIAWFTTRMRNQSDRHKHNNPAANNANTTAAVTTDAAATGNNTTATAATPTTAPPAGNNNT